MNTKEFQKLLKLAINSSEYTTQKAFADATGISPEHLNKMLNQEDISQPSKKTLQKIIRVSNINSKALYKSCGYTDVNAIHAIQMVRKNLPVYQHTEIVANEIVSAVNTVKNMITSFDNVNDILNHITNCCSELQCINIVDTVEDGNMVSFYCNGMWSIVKEGDYETYYYVATTFILDCICLKHKNDSCTWILNDIRISGKDLYKADAICSPLVESYLENNISIDELPCVCVMREREYSMGQEYKNILNAVFGQGEQIKFYNLDYGFGTIVTTIPKNIKSYILNNLEHLPIYDDRQEIINCLYDVDDSDLDAINKILCEFENHKNDDTAWTETIISILTHKLPTILDNYPNVFFEYIKPEVYEEYFEPVLYISEDCYTCNGNTDKERKVILQTFLLNEFRKIGFETIGDVITYKCTKYSEEDIFDFTKRGQMPINEFEIK